ncbi:hypothetical protein BTJ40_10675 [Microbulbifer sp. A4B17]|uniref:hypothetical protein n=1 Tax=Microbulbifer sp. A4B17 TaxID=359370 RepID=UPI000D52C7FF|nr:hypothetical protein [Microbulbifer sp. A4B17]AWF81246.1 hypothetical protein BTJ40_10675 [Microbulbifer sp. A4B17]
MQIKRTTWVVIIACFIGFRTFRFENGGAEAFLVALFIVLTSTYWFVVPYLTGDVIKLPTYTDELIKGTHDIQRTLFFILGLVGVIASMFI